MKEKKISAEANGGQSEFSDTLERIWKENSELTELRYFIGTMHRWCSEKGKKAVDARVVILGTNVPEELVMAAGAKPYFIIGGSLGSISWSEELVPRDTDPVSRSILGYIHQPNGVDFSESMFIVPLTCDSMRKIAYELKEEGRKVFVIDIPPDRSDERSVKKWQMQMLSLTDAVSAHMGTCVTKRSLSASVNIVSKARRSLVGFMDTTHGKSGLITDAARQLVANSYYFTDSLEEWTFHLDALTDQASRMLTSFGNTEVSGPGVLLLGSPVIFPNYKIPFLISDIGLCVLDSADSSSLKNYIVYERKIMRGSCDRVICSIAEKWIKYDASSAFIKNDLLYAYVSWLVDKGDVEGVVFHVLKGQIEYDFELERFESMLAVQNIPVFRLETDYRYNDVEQLRIRLEAFYEMLVQNRYKINRGVQFGENERAVKEVRAAS